jgi:2-keto-4-pentenoate hydratase/2-oxohepta-3-ene-1,7-dioic acid hydratase in catechol pathway
LLRLGQSRFLSTKDLPMKWLRFMHEGQVRCGTLDDEATVHLHAGDLLQDPQPTGTRLPLAGLTLLPPVQPGKVVGLWNNFRAAAQKNGWAEPAEPLYFLKSPGSVIAHGTPIPVPAAYDGRVVYEGELAVVIGRRAQAVSEVDAPAHILGYTCANDVTALELLQRDPSFPQWARAKSFDGFCPLGPVLATELDLATAHLRTLVGGRERQHYALADMFFGPAALVARISQDMTLEPGDVILCGTSLGVLPMKPGTEVQVVVDGIGTLANVYGGVPG